MNDIRAQNQGWPRLGLVLGVIAGAALLYWPSLRVYAQHWSDLGNPTYSHGYVIAAVCVWLLVRQRDRLAAAPIEPRPVAGVALLVVAVAWLLSYRAGIQIGYEILLPLLLWVTVYMVFGWAIARQCLFALGYLYFGVTLWDFINPLAQWTTIFVVRFLLRISGVPSYFDGSFVQLPAGTFHIAGGCSGLNMLIVALALGSLLGELRRDTPRVRVGLVVLAGVLAVITNWVRVYTIILAGYLTDMQHYLVRMNHYHYGWMLFVVAMAGYFLLARRIGKEPAASSAGTESEPPAVPRKKLYATFGIALVVLASVPVSNGVSEAVSGARYSGLAELPQARGGWSGPVAEFTGWDPVFREADRVTHGVYRGQPGASDVEVAVGWYFSQRQGKELGGYANTVLGHMRSKREAGTDRAPADIDKSADAGGRAFVEDEAVDAAGRSWVVWHGYRVGERWYTDATRAQLWYGVRSLAGPVPSRALALRSECVPNCARARQTLHTFIEQGNVE